MPRKKSEVSNIENKLAPALTPETLAIVGESGSGKSVTTRSIMRLLSQNANVEKGEILFNGNDLIKKTEKEMLEKQKELIDAKIKALRTAEATEELYTNAINAMKLYSGQKSSKEIDENYEQQKDIYWYD